MSENLISTLLMMTGPLLGAAVGGFVTFVSLRNIEHQKWKQERQEKLSALKRNALAAALEWIEPMRNAAIRASSLLMSTIRGDIEDERFLNEFPYLLGELVKADLTANQRAVLPDKVYARGHRIVHELDELQYLGVKYGQEAKTKDKPLAGFQESSAKLEAIEQQINDLEKELREEYHRTFGEEACHEGV